MIATRWIIWAERYVRGRFVGREKVESWAIQPTQTAVQTYIKIDAKERGIDVIYHPRNFRNTNNILLAQEKKVKAPKTLILYKLEIEDDLMPNIAVDSELPDFPF